VKRLVALLALLSGCWLTKPQPITPTPPDGGFADASAGQTFKDCSEAAVHQAILGLLPAVETALATQNYVGELAVLVGKYGIAEVVCAVQYAVERSHLQVMATADPLEGTKLANGRAWLATHPVTP
jgi:hypothetical protein